LFRHAIVNQSLESFVSRHYALQIYRNTVDVYDKCRALINVLQRSKIRLDLQPITARVSRRKPAQEWSMFYFAQEAGTGEKLVPEIMTYWPVSGTSQPAPDTGTRNWLVCRR
jgi:hypothetical protein